MAITLAQIPAALQSVGQIAGKLNDIRMLLEQAKELSDKGWQIDIGSRFSLPVTIPVEKRLEMIDKYEEFKSQLVTMFQTLP